MARTRAGTTAGREWRRRSARDRAAASERELATAPRRRRATPASTDPAARGATLDRDRTRCSDCLVAPYTHTRRGARRERGAGVGVRERGCDARASSKRLPSRSRVVASDIAPTCAHTHAHTRPWFIRERERALVAVSWWLRARRRGASPTRCRRSARTWRTGAPRSRRRSDASHERMSAPTIIIIRSSSSNTTRTLPFLSRRLKTRLKQRWLMQSSWQSGDGSLSSFWQCIWQLRRLMTFSSVTGSGVMLVSTVSATANATTNKRAKRASESTTRRAIWRQVGSEVARGSARGGGGDEAAAEEESLTALELSRVSLVSLPKGRDTSASPSLDRRRLSQIHLLRGMLAHFLQYPLLDMHLIH